MENTIIGTKNINDLCGNTWCIHNDKCFTCKNLKGVPFNNIEEVENTKNKKLIKQAYNNKGCSEYLQDIEWLKHVGNEFDIKILQINKYDSNVKELENTFCISNGEENFIDEEIADFLKMPITDYQNTLKQFDAGQYEHKFNYGDGFNRIVQDSYFMKLEDCQKALDFLNSNYKM